MDTPLFLDTDPIEAPIIGEYQNEGYFTINNSLRSHRISPLVYQSVVDLVNLIDQAPPNTEESLTYRAVRHPIYNNLQVGDKVIDDGFSSTTDNYRFTHGISDTILSINWPVGTKFIHSEYEDELLTYPQTEFTVVDIDRHFSRNPTRYLTEYRVDARPLFDLDTIKSWVDPTLYHPNASWDNTEYIKFLNTQITVDTID